MLWFFIFYKGNSSTKGQQKSKTWHPKKSNSNDLRLRRFMPLTLTLGKKNITWHMPDLCTQKKVALSTRFRIALAAFLPLLAPKRRKTIARQGSTRAQYSQSAAIQSTHFLGAPGRSRRSRSDKLWTLLRKVRFCDSAWANVADNSQRPNGMKNT